jgi:hypothetical protein
MMASTNNPLDFIVAPREFWISSLFLLRHPFALVFRRESRPYVAANIIKSIRAIQGIGQQERAPDC